MKLCVESSVGINRYAYIACGTGECQKREGKRTILHNDSSGDGMGDGPSDLEPRKILISHLNTNRSQPRKRRHHIDKIRPHRYVTELEGAVCCDRNFQYLV